MRGPRPAKPSEKALRWYKERFKERGEDEYMKDFGSLDTEEKPAIKEKPAKEPKPKKPPKE